MNSSLTTRVFSLLLVTICAHIVATSPTSNRNGTTKVKSPVERVIRIVIIPLLNLWKLSFWTIAIAETATIIAMACPSSALSNLILSTLVSAGKEREIRLSMATMIAAPMATIGTMIRLICYREMGKYFTFEITIQKDHKLVTTGPYSIVRHPSYTALYFVSIALWLLHGTRGSWVRESGLMETAIGSLYMYGLLLYTLLGLVMGVKRTQVEDRMLRDHFGKEWDDWANRVPYALVPGIPVSPSRQGEAV